MLVLQGHQGPVQALAYAPGGAFLASASHDRTVKLWDIGSQRELCTLRGHRGPVECLAFSPDGRWLASGSLDETVRLWDPATGRERHVLPDHWPLVTAVAFAPDGRTLAVGAGDRISGNEPGQVRLWDTTTMEWRADLFRRLEREHGADLGSAWSLAYSPDGRTLAIGAEYPRVLLWDMAGQELRRALAVRAGGRRSPLDTVGWCLSGTRPRGRSGLFWLGTAASLPRSPSHPTAGCCSQAVATGPSSSGTRRRAGSGRHSTGRSAQSTRWRSPRTA